jgi:hypothetical protein
MKMTQSNSAGSKPSALDNMKFITPLSLNNTKCERFKKIFYTGNTIFALQIKTPSRALGQNQLKTIEPPAVILLV